MKDIFNIKRFGCLLKHDFGECKIFSLLLFISSVLILSVYYFFSNYVSEHEPISIFKYLSSFFILVILLLVVILIPLMTYRFNSKKVKGINYFILPASNFEKFISRLIVYWLIPLCFAFVVYLIKNLIEMPENEEFSFSTFIATNHENLFHSFCFSVLLVFWGMLFYKASSTKLTLSLAILVILILFIIYQLNEHNIISNISNITENCLSLMIYEIIGSILFSIIMFFLSYKKFIKCII